ncbi:MAG: rhodanese-like domain-containing protein [Acidobacteriota bacterium]
MRRNVLFAVAAIAVVALVAFAVVRSGKNPAPPPVAETPAASTPAAMADAPRIKQAELKALFDANNVTLLDVRDAESYLASHIPGSLQIPLSRVEGEVQFLPKGKPIVAYCTCPHDEAAAETVLILEHAGVRGARALAGGLQEWTRLGYPVATGRS